MNFFSQIKDKMKKSENPEDEFKESSQEEYVELGTEEAAEKGGKIGVNPYTLDEFEDVKKIIDSLREGSSIAVINIKPLKEKDITELKRAVAKLRKTCDALNGDVAGFTENIVIATSGVAKINKGKNTSQIKEE